MTEREKLLFLIKGEIKMDFVGLGALNLDVIYRVDFDSCFPLVKKGLERKISANELVHLKKFLEKRGELIIKSGGGSAANTIYALAKLGFSCGFIGKVGEDEEGDFLLEELSKAGVDNSRIVREGNTGICIILVDKRGERSTLIMPGTNDTLVFNQVDMDYIERARFLHTSSFFGEVSFHTQKEIISRIKTRVSFDPGEPHATKKWGQLLPILKKTWILFSTQREIEIISGENFKEGSKKLVQLGIKTVVCKLGSRGSWIVSSEGEWFIPARKTNPVDTTGAGDVYAAGFLAGVLMGLSLPECGKLGTRAAAISITGFGRSNYPEKELLKWTPGHPLREVPF